MKNKLDLIVNLINEAKKKNDALQERFAVNSPEWCACDEIDCKLIEALTELGD